MNFGELGLSAAEPVSGGCIHRCYRAQRDGRAVFLKLNEARFADAFAAEADGLAALRAAGCRAPEPIAHGTAGASAYLLLEFLELRSGGDFASLGTMLAAMHRRQAERYGWPRDNYIGATAQPNGWSESWMAFWRERRLEPQLALAARNGYRIDVPPVWQLLEGHEPAPSLLHGDLWSGNAAAASMPMSAMITIKPPASAMPPATNPSFNSNRTKTGRMIAPASKTRIQQRFQTSLRYT